MSQKTTNSLVLKLWLKQIKPFWFSLFGIATLITLANVFWLAVPWGYKTLAADLTQSNIPPAQAWRGLYIIIAAELICSLFYRLSEYWDAYNATKILAHLYKLAYDKTITQPHQYFENHHTGSLVRRVNQYVNAYDTIIQDLLWQTNSQIIMIVGSAIILGRQNKMFSIVILTWSIVYVALIWAITLYRQRYDLAEAKFDRQAASQLNDTIVNSLALKTNTTIHFERQRYGRIVDDQTNQQRISWMFENGFEALQSLSMLTLEVVMISIAIHKWQQGLIVFSDIVLIQAFILPIMTNFWSVGRTIRRSYRVLAEARDLATLFYQPDTLTDIPDAKKLRVTKGKIVFNRLTFSYNNNQAALRNLNLTIKPGEKIALVGPSGAGKSTITKLLLRLYDCPKGQILIDGQDISQVTQESLRKQITYVPQEALLFHRTIRENIAYGQPRATQNEIITAAKEARADQFIKKLPKGYDTVVGERGMKLSGGERQRIALARAFMQQSPIIMLDEPTSSLDSLSEKEIQKSLPALFADRTVIVIAHRLATIKEMDRICVLKDGHIVEEGTHQTLTELKKGTYQKLWEIQGVR